MRRFIFLSLGVLSTLLPTIISIMMGRSVGDIILLTVTTYMVYVLVSILIVLIWVFVSNGSLPDVGDDIHDIPPFFWFLTLGRKRIYYSDLGYFYVSIKGDYVSVHKQGFLLSHYLFNVWYGGDIESLRSSIKSELDSLYAKELVEARSKKLKKDNLRSWDGYIDIVSKRDDKLKDLLK